MAAAPQDHSLQIKLLGEPEVILRGKSLPLPASKKTRALLGYLVATGRPQRRERICELLWDGPDDPRAGLRWSLSKLRPILDADGAIRLVADRERVSFEREGVDVDVLAVDSLDRRALAAAPISELTRALSAFRGPFLEGLELSSCPAFHAWCVAEREKLRALHVALLTALLEREKDSPDRALHHARSLIALDPLSESSRLLLLDLLTTQGEVRRALEEYEDYARTLERELGVKPSFELQQRRMAMTRALSLPAPAPASAAAPSSAPPREPSASLSAEISGGAPVFVGREREREALDLMLDRRGRGPSVLLVLGEPGIGKTRLLEELARLARERGGLAFSGRAFEAELVRPYGAFIDALRAAFPQRDVAPSSESFASLLPAPFAAQATDRTRLYDAVMSRLAAAARERSPLLLVLDDLHWFDEASSELLHYLARALMDAPVLIAAAARQGELDDNPSARRLVRALQRERLVRSIELGPLTRDELRTLVVGSGVERRESALERVWSESAGNPLFALEAARALQAGSEDLVGSLSLLIGERLGRLQEADRALLSWAGALGRSFDVDVLARVTAFPVPALLASLERLERHTILRSRDAGYDFAHDLIRQAAYRQMSGPRQRLVHAQIARALAAAPDPEGALAGDVAHHAALAADHGLAARACVTAARRCLRLFAFREARELTSRGSRLAASLSDAERVHLQVELLAIRLVAEPDANLDTPITSLVEEARALGLPSVEARAFFLRSLLQFRAGNSEAALASSLARIQAARRAGPLDLAGELAGAARCYLLIEKNLDVAEQFLAQAERMLGADAEQLDLHWSQGLLAQLRGDLTRADERIGRALSLARREQAHWEECECLLALAWISFDRGEHDRVLAHAVELARVAEKLEESAYGPMASALEALVGLVRLPRPAFDALEHAVIGLEHAGASRLLSVVQNRAAELALSRGAREHASAFAERALRAAERVERVNEIALARTLLAELALEAGQTELARRHLDALAVHSLGPDLSARSASAIARMRERMPNVFRASVASR